MKANIIMPSGKIFVNHISRVDDYRMLCTGSLIICAPGLINLDILRPLVYQSTCSTSTMSIPPFMPVEPKNDLAF